MPTRTLPDSTLTSVARGEVGFRVEVVDDGSTSNLDPHRKAPLIGVVHLLARIDEESDVLDSDVVVMRSPVGWPQPKVLLAEAEVDDFFGPAVARARLRRLQDAGVAMDAGPIGRRDDRRRRVAACRVFASGWREPAGRSV